ncbi:MAG: hypothetical protein IJA05_07345 [Oscillospiraceae bacterium]|nr:hypothetical protein [Oscillospiraceae bacterium]
MRKNKMMRAASALLVAVLLTTSTISGTFAKYVTTAEAEDSARVAKWGVEVGVTGNLFNDSYKEEPTTWTANETGLNITVQADSKDDDVVAPGTQNTTGITFILRGTPEVETNVEFEFTINDEIVLPVGDDYVDFTKALDYDKALDKPVYDTFDVTGDPYYPVVFTLRNGADDILVEGNLTAIKNYLEGLNNIYDTNTDLAKIGKSLVDPSKKTDGTYTLTWVWDFDDAGAGTYDKEDTYLGQVASGKHTDANAHTEMDVKIAITVTQVD